MMDERLLLTVNQAAERLGISRTLTYALVMSRELPSVKLGRARRVPTAELQRFVDRLVEERG